MRRRDQKAPVRVRAALAHGGTRGVGGRQIRTSDDPRQFDFAGDTYTTEWPLADERGWKFFRLSEGTLAPKVVAEARARSFQGLAALRFDVSAYEGGRLADVELLRGARGWLRVAKLTVITQAVTREHLVLAVVPEGDATIHPETVDRLLGVPAANLGAPPEPAPDARLDAAEAAQISAILQEAERQNSTWLETESDKLDNYAEDLERAFEAQIKTVEAEIREAKKALRGSDLPLAAKLDAKRRISALQARRDRMKAEYFDKRAEIRAEVDSMLDQIQESLRMQPNMAPLFTIRWEVA